MGGADKTRMRILIKMAAEGDFSVGATVWYHSDKETGWWPCIVSRAHKLKPKLTPSSTPQVTEVRTGEERENAVRLQSLGDRYE